MIDKCRLGQNSESTIIRKRSVIAVEANGTPGAIKETLSKKITLSSICKRGCFRPTIVLLQWSQLQILIVMRNASLKISQKLK